MLSEHSLWELGIVRKFSEGGRIQGATLMAGPPGRVRLLGLARKVPARIRILPERTF
jgi:hypothetical protein